MRIIVAGSREWTDRETIRHTLASLSVYEPVIVHGAARGADELAGDVAAELDLTVEEHPADWSHGKRAGIIRNQKMVNLGADLVLAFDASGPGTASTVKFAKKAGIPVLELLPGDRYTIRSENNNWIFEED